MNCKNANQELGFDKFAECDYNLHWSFSNFNRMLMAAGQIARLPLNALVLELGAGSSELENIVSINFKRTDIRFVKVDGDTQYESNESITVLDITKLDSWRRIPKESFDAVVFMEVIEHLAGDEPELILKKISGCLKSEALLILTTPTPPFEMKYETEVWPTDHNREFTFEQVYGMVNRWFKVVKEIGWSLEEREYNKLLEQASPEVCKIYSKLKGAFPESYIRAIMSCVAPVEYNRQVLLVCKKRRVTNGRFAQA